MFLCIDIELLKYSITIMQTAAHNKGEIPAGSSFYSMSNEKLVMTTFKKCEDRNNLIFRFFNPNETEQSTEISFLKDIKNAYICNLNEERIEDIKVKGNSVNLEVQKRKIVTIEIEF